MFGSGISLADIAAVTRGNGNDDGFGGNNGWWVLIILFALFGGWGDNNGRNNGGNSGGSSGELQRGFDTQSIISKLDGLSNGICSLGYDQLAQMNNLGSMIMQGNFGLQNAIQQQTIAQMQDTNALSRQFADCCCENRSAIAQVRYDMATDACAITTAIKDAVQQIMQNDNANYRQLHDEQVAMQMQAMRDQIAQKDSMINALNLAASQQNQTHQIVTQTIEQLRQCPIGTYNVCNPNANNGGCGFSGC